MLMGYTDLCCGVTRVPYSNGMHYIVPDKLEAHGILGHKHLLSNNIRMCMLLVRQVVI